VLPITLVVLSLWLVVVAVYVLKLAERNKRLTKEVAELARYRVVKDAEAWASQLIAEAELEAARRLGNVAVESSARRQQANDQAEGILRAANTDRKEAARVLEAAKQSADGMRVKAEKVAATIVAAANEEAGLIPEKLEEKSRELDRVRMPSRR
jgi:hypothetical protein